MPNGLTSDQMLERMYTALVGLDGNSGIVREIENAKDSRARIHSRIDSLEKETISKLVSKESCLEIQEELPAKIGVVVERALKKKGRNKWLVIKDVVIIAGIVLTLFLGSSLLPRMMSSMADSVRKQIQQEMEENKR